MANSYDVQHKAQEEMRSIIGNDRLPTFEDRPSLPYVDAIYREVLRWKPVGPFSIFHATNEEDIYRGFYIPKGATVIPNIQCVTSTCCSPSTLNAVTRRTMSRDPKKYHNPEVFNPSRFLLEDGRLNDDEVQYVFGFGRRYAITPLLLHLPSYKYVHRICLGRYFAADTIWLSIVRMLFLFDIRKKKDSAGNEIPVDGGFSTGFVV